MIEFEENLDIKQRCIIFIITLRCMKMAVNNKFDAMSLCLKTFKEMPQNLENYAKTSNKNLLSSLIECSNTFIALATDSQDFIESETPLYNRFFSRLRQTIFSYLNHYIHTGSFIFIREMLIDIHKNIIEQRPSAGYHHILINVSNVIMNSVSRIAQSRHFSPQVIAQLFNTCVKFQPKIAQSFDQKYTTISHNSALKPKQQNTPAGKTTTNTSKSKLSTESSLSKIYGLEVLGDVDESVLDRFMNKDCRDQLYNQCYARNRYICQIMKRYQEQFMNYQSKPNKRKNRQGPQYQPTTNPTFRINSQNIKKRQAATSQRKRLTKISFTNTHTQQFFNNFQQTTIQQDALKVDLINHLYASRQKYALRKVMIGASEVTQQAQKQRQRQSHNVMKTFSRTYRTCNMKSQRRSSSKNGQKIKVMKNKNSRSCITGVVSVSLRKNVQLL